jgi:aryl-alcohol dehydrogenase-like predicted oxidoreductase
MAERGNRDRLIVATKYTSEYVPLLSSAKRELMVSYQSYKYGKNEVTNLCGNSKKSMHVSIKESLRKLQTDYVDIFYIHFVSIPLEVFNRLT